MLRFLLLLGFVVVVVVVVVFICPVIRLLICKQYVFVSCSLLNVCVPKKERALFMVADISLYFYSCLSIYSFYTKTWCKLFLLS